MVKEIKFETVGEYIHCVALGTDGKILFLSEAAAKRDAAHGVLRELLRDSKVEVSPEILARLKRDSLSKRI